MVGTRNVYKPCSNPLYAFTNRDTLPAVMLWSCAAACIAHRIATVCIGAALLPVLLFAKRQERVQFRVFFSAGRWFSRLMLRQHWVQILVSAAARIPVRLYRQQAKGWYDSDLTDCEKKGR